MGRIQWPPIVDQARRIVEGYGGGVTLRQVHYRLVAARVLPNTPPAYRRLSSRLAQARREGCFPDLIDTLREVRVAPSWPDAAAFLDEAPAWFRLDRTRGQSCALYVAAEKDTLRIMFTDWLADFGIPVVVVRGFGSQSYVEILRHRTRVDPRPAVLLFVGDFDASGEGAERDWISRTGCWAHAERILLTRQQVLLYGLPAAGGEREDPCWPAFAARHGLDPDRPAQWEVEAMEPVELQRVLLAAVEPYVDHRVLAAVLAEEDRQHGALRAFTARWNDAGR